MDDLGGKHPYFRKHPVIKICLIVDSKVKGSFSPKVGFHPSNPSFLGWDLFFRTAPQIFVPENIHEIRKCLVFCGDVCPTNQPTNYAFSWRIRESSSNNGCLDFQGMDVMPWLGVVLDFQVWMSCHFGETWPQSSSQAAKFCDVTWVSHPACDVCNLFDSFHKLSSKGDIKNCSNTKILHPTRGDALGTYDKKHHVHLSM